MPVLSWLGKEKVVNHDSEVPFHVMDKQYTYGGEGDVGNRIIHGDNLITLKSLLPEYEGKIDCIYIDPPYNTGEEKWVYNDNLSDPRISKWLNKVVGKKFEDLSRHDKWLCMMYPRLVLLRKLLSESGSIFISIDDNEQATMKILCDEIFGENNFVNKFVWKKNSSGKTVSREFPTNIEYIYMYSKCRDKHKFNVVFKPLAATTVASYSKDDGDGRGKYCTVSLQKTKNPGPETTYDYVDNTGRVWPCPAKGWRMIKSKVKDLENDGRLYMEGKTLREKVYWNERESDGQYADTLWDDMPEGNVGTGEVNKILGKEMFDYPKPVDLIKRCIEIGSNKDSIILDSFAGSGTTAHAVLKLNKEDGGNRKFILCEMNDYADAVTAERVKRVINGYKDGKNDVQGIKASFDFYKLGEPLFNEENINANLDIDVLRKYIAYSQGVKPNDYLQLNNEISPHAIALSKNTLWLFNYEPHKPTSLDLDFLGSIRLKHLENKPSQFIAYADRCLLDEATLRKYNITFKRLPRDIVRF